MKDRIDAVAAGLDFASSSRTFWEARMSTGYARDVFKEDHDEVRITSHIEVPTKPDRNSFYTIKREAEYNLGSGLDGVRNYPLGIFSWEDGPTIVVIAPQPGRWRIAQTACDFDWADQYVTWMSLVVSNRLE